MSRERWPRRAVAKGLIGSVCALQTSRLPASAAQAGLQLEGVAPELRAAAVAALRESEQLPTLSADTLATLRPIYATADVDADSPIRWERRIIAGPGSAQPLAVYVVNAATQGQRPAILHMHGGGFVLGSPLAFMQLLQSVAHALDCVIVSVDYRLAPETGHAEAIEDNYAALKWLYANASALGADRDRIAVMGESAGGGHAALLALMARDRGEVPLAFQCLTYPMLDDRTGSSRQVSAGKGRLVWTARQNHFGWASFLGMPPGTSLVPRSAVPARATDLRGLPPCFIAVGSIDLFADEDVDYARRLATAGVSTELHVVAGAFHGFDLFPEAQAAWCTQHMKNARIAALRAGFGMPLPPV